MDEYYRIAKSEEILEKVGENHFQVKAAFNKALLACEIVDPKREIRVILDDPSDNKVLECAVEAGADFIITYWAKDLQRWLKK